jgi:catechol 2,3-dioxygenase-like lactoylglutathione lyase family enzyme
VIDHVDIRVSDPDASLRFYDTVLSVLGKERLTEPTHAEWGGDFSVALDDQPVTRNLHIAFFAPTTALVDAFHRAGVEAGYADDGAPGPRPRYGDDDYGAFLRDPDGNSVEAVTHGRTRATGAIDHLWFRTRGIAAIKAFYVAIGQRIGIDTPEHVQIVTDGASFSFVNDGGPPTEHVHLAFGVDTNEAVDAFHRAAIDAGYTDNGPPGERAAYHPGYYGAFVLDPDGHNIEAVSHNR